MERIKDSWQGQFATERELLDEMVDVQEQTRWYNEVPSKSLRVQAIDLKDYENPSEAITDTTNNTGLLVNFNGQQLPVRDTAIKSLMETAKLNGSGWAKLSKTSLALVVNELLNVSSGNTLLLERDGKIAAVLSDNAGGYGELPVDQAFQMTDEYVKDRFGKVTFGGGAMGHDYVTAVWTLDQYKKEITDEYKKLLKADSIYEEEFEPVVRFTTSDTGISALTLVPLFRKKNGTYVRINGDIKLPHKKGVSIADYPAKLNMLFSTFVDAAKKFAELSTIIIDHPHNAFMLACKKAQLPKKVACHALEEFKMYVGEDDKVTAHDIYLGICETLTYALRAGYSPKDMCRLEDLCARCLGLKWEDFDLPGEHKW